MPRTLFDLTDVDLSATALDHEAIGKINPHRHEFRLLDRVCHLDADAGIAVGTFAVRDDQFWVRGHIPGRPLFPGVLQIEAAAQLCSVLASTLNAETSSGFFGFFGVDKIKFRKQVGPGDDLILLVKITDNRRVARFETQILVGDSVVFSGEVLGSTI